jgi:hypothetical protein
MRTNLMVRTLLAAAATLLFYGCASSNAGAPAFNPTSTQHPADWSTAHPAAYLANPSSCTPCHGSAKDPSQAGGTTGISCFGCHHPNGPSHPANWADPAQHGRLGAQLPVGTADFSMQGFASCQVCHGTGFTGSGIAVSCFTCHQVQAPHPKKPWGAGLPAGSSSVSHASTDASNAPTCFVCHQSGSQINQDLNIAPVTPAAGAQPGCFNNTMCHGNPQSGSPQ